ncbi:Protein phosphatase 2C [Cynara cardunculus var. scolymus]|uniref:Protein phosphatase 2C n=1 Tax=Cynara cardunculus var. scolymus TaxID=59895 RepID=A0A118K4H7_CYNCS|nr:Protein phosphatase 2C [Cynara cardunculus var. scolymus]
MVLLTFQNFASRTDTVFCGVFDGHGPYGHMVAKRVRDSLPLKLSAHWDVNVKGSSDVLREVTLNSATSLRPEETTLTPDEDSRTSQDLELDKNSEKLQALKDLFLKAFKVMDRELRMHANVDCFCSGTTAVTLIKQGQDLIIGNVGDSRAILCTRDKKDSLVAVQLTVDLKPNIPAEAERIRKCKGRVFALQDEPEVTRVWLPNNDSPGLAMARAFGDFCLKDFEIFVIMRMCEKGLWQPNPYSLFVLKLQVWDVLTNKEVVDIVASAETRSCAARSVVQSAVRAWKFRYPTSKVDDCAVICLFLTPQQVDNIPTATATNLAEKVGTGADEDLVDDEVVRNEGVDSATMKTEAGIDWSALEGVSRVNTMLRLPRFVPEETEKPTPGQK